MVLTIFVGSVFKKNSYPSTIYPSTIFVHCRCEIIPWPWWTSSISTRSNDSTRQCGWGHPCGVLVGGEKPTAWEGEILRKAVAFLGFQISRGDFLFADCIVRFEIHQHFFHQHLGSECFLELEPKHRRVANRSFLGLWDVRPFSWSLRAVFSLGGVDYVLFWNGFLWGCMCLKWQIWFIKSPLKKNISSDVKSPLWCKSTWFFFSEAKLYSPAIFDQKSHGNGCFGKRH